MTFSDRDATMDALTRALPYIRLYRDRTFVLKAGGAICSDARALRELADQVGVLRELGIRIVLVHGGGPQTSALSERLGLPATFVEGRRVTCERTLEVAVMTLGGSVNTALLSAFRAAGVPAVGLSGLDAGLVRAVRRPAVVRDGNTVDYGLVGDIVGTDPTVLQTLLAAGMVPVVCPLSADASGQVLNVNADTVASTLARAISAEKLVFLTDTAGLLSDVRDPGSLVSYTDVRGLEDLKARGAFDAGMLPKVKAAIDALEGGVRRVHLVGYRPRGNLLAEIFTNEGAGTLVVREASELATSEQLPALAASAR